MNAKKEFLEQIRYVKSRVIAVEIKHEYSYGSFNTHSWRTGEDWDAFLSSLDFEYDSGYGSQMLHGTIWYEDGTWSEREEYDGSEWWSHRKCPEIPSYLK